MYDELLSSLVVHIIKKAKIEYFNRLANKLRKKNFLLPLTLSNKKNAHPLETDDSDSNYECKEDSESSEDNEVVKSVKISSKT